jgi:hypothetical protein
MKQEGLFPEGERGPVARRTDPATSWAAARSIKPESLRESQRAVLSVLQENGPGTDSDIWDWLLAAGVLISPSGARTRRGELVEKGFVEWNGECKVLPSGRSSNVWEAHE